MEKIREILFRGQDKKGNMVYGSLIRDYRLEGTESESVIRQGNSNTNVLSETVGQFTSLKDKNDRKIFEGDIIKHGQSIRFICMRWGNWFADKGSRDETIQLSYIASKKEPSDRCEVIGNIYESPNLLKQ